MESPCDIDVILAIGGYAPPNITACSANIFSKYQIPVGGVFYYEDIRGATVAGNFYTAYRKGIIEPSCKQHIAGIICKNAANTGHPAHPGHPANCLE